MGQQDATDKVVKKLASERSYIFKKKGYEQQFHFNAEVEDHILKAKSEAGKVQPATEKDAKVLEKLQAELIEGTQAIAYRQKRIKVADCLDFGWVTVEEYDRDELTSDSDDEKGLFKAERNAEWTQKREDRLIEEHS